MRASSKPFPSSGGPLSFARLVAAGLRYHWRTHLAVALAVMASTAVLTGALLVGDSMRGSLRHLVLDQLGAIDEVLVTDRFFRAELAREVRGQPHFDAYFAQAIPAIYVRATVENPALTRRAGNVNVIGSGAEFFSLGGGGPEVPPGADEIVLNAPLAEHIGAAVGDEVLLRVGSTSQVPPDSALGRKTETIRNRRLRVSAVIAAAGLGRLSLNPSQQLPLNAFVQAETLQNALDQHDKVNAIFVAGKVGRLPSLVEEHTLNAEFAPKLADYGLAVESNKLGYAQLTSGRMVLEDAVVSAALRAFDTEQTQPLFTYLANAIEAHGRSIPYSTITAIDLLDTPPLGPLLSSDGKPIEPLAEDEIVLNTWAADDLGARPGDEVEITYFEPESTHGTVVESKARFRLKAVTPLEGLAADPNLTPQLPGVTDQLSIGDWDPPFPFDQKRVRDKDEAYWDDRQASEAAGRPLYRTTPKAFIALDAGRTLWASRFGDTTAVRFAPPLTSRLQTQVEQLEIDPRKLGFEFRPVKRLALAAAGGTTPFDALFLGFSSFLMIASLLLVALVYQLGIEQRASEIGVLRSVGLPRRKIFGLLAAEGLAVAAIGSLLGVAGGAAYAWLMINGLSTWWIDAIRTPFLELHARPGSLLAGFSAGLLVALLTILWTLGRMGRLSVRRLLAGQATPEGWTYRSPARASLAAAIGLMALAGAAMAVAPRLGAEAQAGAFVASGALALAAALAFFWHRMRRGAMASLATAGALPIYRLAARNGARNPLRSALSIGLIAAASFLIVALSAFRLDPAALGTGRDSGSGGYALVAETAAPIYQDLNSEEGRFAQLGMPERTDALAAQCQTVALRVENGDDASCLNLYRPSQPRVLGAGDPLIERGGFAWGPTLAETPEEHENPWRLLYREYPQAEDGPLRAPAIVDMNTAAYSLHKGLGDTIEVTLDDGARAELHIVGLLKNSIFQGDVIVSEWRFLDMFPTTSGYRYFLIDTGRQPPDQVAAALEGALGDYGFDAQFTQARLSDLFAVQNTYLSTFQSLGGLGLLLGTLGLATAQLRSVFERRGELALLRAAGFRRSLLARLVMIENALLLVGGLAVGVLAALVAVLPHWLAGGAAVPWLSLAATLALVLFAGLAAGTLAVRATLRAELLPALREE